MKIGGGAINDLPDVLNQLALHRPLIVTDEFIVSQEYVGDLIDLLREQGFALQIFSDCVPDPTTDSVAAALVALKQFDADCLVALGGGSSIDTAKAASVLAVHSGRMRDYKAPNNINNGLPVIAIPTTAGTGSEATSVAVIVDTETQEKMMCKGLGLLPVAALVDFELTMTMPYRLTADTGIDSLCHALEAYVSRRANAFTDSIALAAMKTIYKMLPTVCNQLDNHNAREAMMLAATQGGIAFSNASVTLIHAMSRPIGAHFHVPHGLSNAMLLPEITAFSVAGAEYRYAQCSRVMGITDSDDDQYAADALVAALYKLNSDLSVPSPKEYGIDQNYWFGSVDLMAEQAIESGSPANNPRIPSQADIVELYHSVWN
tara:strand:+ start:632 stop:1756 length:1125 start_codon:yes stop_codon:yes gene_type:complete